MSSRVANRRRPLRVVGLVGLYIGMCLAAAVFLGPFLLMIAGSFRHSSIFIDNPWFWLPSPFTIDNFLNTVRSSQFPRWFLNSTIISVVPTCTDVLVSLFLGYIFAKRKFPGKEIVFWILMTMIMVPSQVLLIPRYLLFSQFGWINTYWALIVPGAWNVVSVFLMRQFISTIPDDLEEAARIDGAGDLYVVFGIIAKLAVPAMATVAIFTFIGLWNDLLDPLIFLNSPNMYPLTVGLATLIQQQGNFGLQMAGATITFVPTVIVYLLLQRYFTEGIALTGLK